MQMIKTGVMALALLGATAVPAMAQSRGFVGGLAGVTFNTTTSSAVAGRGGVGVGGGLFVFGEVGRIMDVLPGELADQLDDLEEFFEEQAGLPISIEAKVPATYFMGGVRWEGPGEGRLRPFVEGGFGVARMTADLSATIAGTPVPDEVIDEFNDLDLESTDPFMAIGGGVTIRLTDRVAVDAGYRFMKVFVEDVGIDTPSVTPNLVYAGIVLSFGR